MKGIIFSEHNFHLTVNGVKTQTRRVIKPQPVKVRSFGAMFAKHPGYEISEKPWSPVPAHHFLMSNEKYINPRYKVGDTVYLKEPYCDELDFYTYKFSDLESPIFGDKWKNPLFMPESAARHFIKITGVRAERLQDINDEDCLKEGIKVGKCGNESNWMKAFYCPDDNQPYITAKDAYEAEFNMINGKDSWEQNPWVWVYDYQILK